MNHRKAAVLIATLKITMPDDFTQKIQRLADTTDSIIEKALEAGAEIVLTKVRANLAGAIGSGTKYPSQSTGELLGSLGVTPVKQDNVGALNLKVGFNEPRRKQTKAKGKRSYKKATNAMVASVLEHGRHGQPRGIRFLNVRKMGAQGRKRRYTAAPCRR